MLLDMARQGLTSLCLSQTADSEHRDSRAHQDACAIAPGGRNLAGGQTGGFKHHQGAHLLLRMLLLLPSHRKD